MRKSRRKKVEDRKRKKRERIEYEKQISNPWWAKFIKKDTDGKSVAAVLEWTS